MPSSPSSTSRRPDADPPEGFVSDYLLYLLAAASDGASTQFHAQLRKWSLRVPEWRVLACLYDTQDAMVTHLAAKCLFEQSRLTRIIAQMEERELVLRRSDPKDGRRVRVSLTAQGRDIADTLVPLAKKHEAALLGQLPKDQADALKPILKALLDVIEADPAQDA